MKVSPDRLRKVCDPESLPFNNTEELKPLVGVVGQDRAVHALDFSLDIKANGFNLYAAGPVGTGKHSAITARVKEVAETKPVPADWCYVNNFKVPDKPIVIKLPPGKGPELAKDMDELIEACKSEIPKAFDSEEYERRKDSILNEFQSKRDQLLARLRHEAARRGFSVELTTLGIVTIPIIDGRLMKREEYDRLPKAEKERIQKLTEELQQEINHVMAQIRSLEKETKRKIQELDKQIALFAIGHLLDDLRLKYQENKKLLTYLQAVQEDIIENLENFKTTEKKELRLPGMELPEAEPPFEKYKVNVFITNIETKGAPVVYEPNPTYYNLVGRIEYAPRLGTMVTNFTMIKPGALHRANGGYLILNVFDVLINFMSWQALKRALKTRQATIENIGEQFRLIPTTTLRPEPIELNVKVVLIGNRWLYNLLYMLDEDFKKLFKVKADFNVEMDYTDEHVRKYAALIASRCQQEKLKHFDKTGVAKIVEYGARLAEDQKKLSTRFLEINDLITEASYWASRNGNTYVTGIDVQKAIQEKIYRSSMIEEKIREMIADGTIFIDTEGAIVGQVNGLSIIFLGDYMFGKPSRITSQIHLGKKGVINIEREAKLGGRIYNKAVMILAGFLAGRYAHNKPLSISATIGFEQSYEMVEGDSASSAELYAILSSLANLPLRQDIAVTGSVNQLGQVQPIGAVNRKIEGFYDVCRVKGLTGTQGVMIPKANIKNLMLREDVIEAVNQGKFHIWAVETIDEGLELLTGKKAGRLLPDGTWEPDSVNFLVDKRLHELAQQMLRFEAAERRAAA